MTARKPKPRAPKPVSAWAIVRHDGKIATYDFASDSTYWIYTKRKNAERGCDTTERVIRVVITPEARDE